MKSYSALILLSALSALLLAGCGSEKIPDGTVVSIIYSADMRGKLQGCGCQNGGGGIARRSAAIAGARSEDPTVVFCDAGNFLSGTPESDKSQGKATLAAYNYLEPTAVNVSERELAFGMDAFRAARKDAKFSFVSANLQHKGGMVSAPYVVKKVKEARVAFIGVCGSKDLMRTDSSLFPPDITIEDPVVSVRRAMVALDKKADLVVVLSTCGDAVDSLIAESVPTVDVIIGGRSFRPNETAPWVIGKTRILRPQRDGRSMGRMDLVFGPEAKIKTYSPSVIADPNGPLDEKMITLVRQHVADFADSPAEPKAVATSAP